MVYPLRTTKLFINIIELHAVYIFKVINDISKLGVLDNIVVPIRNASAKWLTLKIYFIVNAT